MAKLARSSMNLLKKQAMDEPKQELYLPPPKEIMKAN
jgi:hypothetical protein